MIRRSLAFLPLHVRIVVVAVGLALAGCAAPATEAPPTTAPVVPTVQALPTLAATPTVENSSPTEAVNATTAATAPAEGQLRLVLAPEGNEARYLVREQLANLSFPSDAVGATRDITGGLVLNADGTVVPEASRFVVDLTTLRSDSDRRDGYVQRNTLETGRFPTAEFVATEVRGLPFPLPTTGEVTFQLVGDLTVHGVTRPTTWDVTAQATGDALVGRASTSFTFDDFSMRVPRVASVLSVEETIRLEYDFHLVLAPTG